MGLRDSGDDEGVDAVVGEGVSAGEALVDENRKAEFVGFFDGVVEGVV